MRRIACLLVPEREPAMQRELLDVALAHSPRVEEGGRGFVYLDVAGLEGLFGDEAEIGRRLVRCATERGLRAQVGIAGSRIGALLASRWGRGVAVITPGKEAAYLAPAPLSLLDLSDEMGARLHRWGIRTLGELAALPAASLFERLGSEGLSLQRLARGEDPRPLKPWKPEPAFEESVDLDWPVETIEPLITILSKLARLICERLGRQGVSADQFEWACRLADRTVHEGGFSPALPMNEPSAVTPLLRAALESRPPRGAVEAVTLRARPVRTPALQGSLMDPARPSPRIVTATLARIAALVGSRRLGVPVLLDSHRPDAVELAPYPHPERSLSPPGLQSPSPYRGAALALRRLRPLLPASVTLTAGRPVSLRSDRLKSRIVTSVGPWRSSGEWWTGSPWIHDEWDVELHDGTVCRLAHDGSAWWLEGIYD